MSAVCFLIDERQISDSKRKLIAQIRQGIMGKVVIKAEEVETLISTRYKVGYMLNVTKENVRILGKDGLLWMALSVMADWGRISFLLFNPSVPMLLG